MASFEKILTHLFNKDNNSMLSDTDPSRSGVSPVNSEDIVSMLGLDDSFAPGISYIIDFCNDNNMYITNWDDLRAVCNYIIDNHLASPTINENLNHIMLKIGVAEYFGLHLISGYHGTGLKSITGVAEISNSFGNVSSGEEFEWFCTSILEKNGYTNIITTPVSGDHGVDIITEKDSIKYAIQCKYYSSPVGNKAVQEVFSGRAFYKCDIAVVMTNNTFTKQAIQEATALGVKLWDVNYLQSLVNT